MNNSTFWHSKIYHHITVKSNPDYHFWGKREKEQTITKTTCVSVWYFTA